MFARLVMDATNAVALPLFARTTREQGSSREPWLRATGYVTVLGWSFAAGVALLGAPLVLLLHGPQWGEAVPPLRWMALGMAVGLPAALCPQLLIGAGQAGRVLRLTLFATFCQILCTSIGACFGLEQAALGFAGAQLLALFSWLHGARQVIAFSWGELATLLVRSALCAVLAALGPLLVVLIWGSAPAHPALPLLWAAVAGGLLLLLGLRLAAHPLWSECERMAGFLRGKLHVRKR
jgi:O-antigen/teichoic acid export membrane protein